MKIYKRNSYFSVSIQLLDEGLVISGIIKVEALG